ncbi:MAG TPA: signal peptidase II [Phycisphaerales bacterium]|nr:signal peptidase II [Phycisphaerales bacterium]HMP37380.1 signal peptidase II [Phycisphaerales bacterium]
MTAHDPISPATRAEAADSRPSPEGSESPKAAARSELSRRGTLRSPRAWLTLLVPFACSLALDLWSKAWAFRTVAGAPVELRRDEIAGNPSYELPRHQGVSVLPWDLLDFHLVLNHGAVFGLGSGRRSVFVAFTIIAACVALWVFARLTAAKDTLAHIGLGLVLAGGIGNLVDRIFFGAVRDFLHMLPRWHLPFNLRWPGGNPEVFPWVFNVADVSLLSGMAILLVVLNRRGEPAGVPPARSSPEASAR